MIICFILSPVPLSKKNSVTSAPFWCHCSFPIVNLAGWIERKAVSLPHSCKFCERKDWDQAKATYLSNWPWLKKSFNWRPHNCWFICAKNYKAGQTSSDLSFSLFFFFSDCIFSCILLYLRLLGWWVAITVRAISSSNRGKLYLLSCLNMKLWHLPG